MWHVMDPEGARLVSETFGQRGEGKEKGKDKMI